LQLIDDVKPEIVLFGATATGRDLAGAIATHLPTGLTADTTELDVEPPPSRLLLASRPAFSEKMMATILCKQYRPQMATARAGVFQALPKDTSRVADIICIKNRMQEEEIATHVLDFIRETGKVNLEEAEIIVSGGRGLGGQSRLLCSKSWQTH
jgi:electron transfer flavoprotein alpha subunit